MKRSRKKQLHRMRKNQYDLLYRDDPKTANLMLLIWESERLEATQGVKPCFGNFKETTEELSEFMDRNGDALTRIFNETFEDLDPTAYHFGKLRLKFQPQPEGGAQ